VAERYALWILPTAAQELRRVRPQAQKRLRRAIDGLATDPRPHGAKLLGGPGGDRIWRIRVGDFRVLYRIRDEEPVVLVIRVAHRRDVHR
jgi:mRNA interferase RelE/StbE